MDEEDDGTMEPNPDFDPDFDIPFADPAIRAEYRDALGRFIMAHNEVDFWLAGILTKAVKILAPDGSLDRLAMGDFAQRLSALGLLRKVAPHLGFGGADVKRLGELNGTRNTVAHGHFDQDPFDGTYALVKGRHQTLKKERVENLSTATINAQAKELEEAARHMSTVFDFIDFAVPSEYFTNNDISMLSAQLWEAYRAKADSAA